MKGTLDSGRRVAVAHRIKISVSGREDISVANPINLPRWIRLLAVKLITERYLGGSVSFKSSQELWTRLKNQTNT